VIIRTNLTFLEIINLHFPLTVWIYLHSNFAGGPIRKAIFRKSAFWPFKVIQGHWYWYESKARICDFP